MYVIVSVKIFLGKKTWLLIKQVRFVHLPTGKMSVVLTNSMKDYFHLMVLKSLTLIGCIPEQLTN